MNKDQSTAARIVELEALLKLADARINALVDAQSAQVMQAVPVAKNGRQVLVDASALQMVLNALERDACAGQQVRAEMRFDLMQSIARPTQQGPADLRWQVVHDHIRGEYIAGRACFVVQIPALPGANIMRGSVAEHFTKAVDAIAAQAKQA